MLSCFHKNARIADCSLNFIIMIQMSFWVGSASSHTREIKPANRHPREDILYRNPITLSHCVIVTLKKKKIKKSMTYKKTERDSSVSFDTFTFGHGCIISYVWDNLYH